MYIKMLQVSQYNSINLSGGALIDTVGIVYNGIDVQHKWQCPCCIFNSEISIRSHDISPGSSARNSSDLLRLVLN